MISVFDHPILSGLLGDDAMAELLSPQAELGAMLRFEAALAAVEGGLGIIPAESGEAIDAALATFEPDIAGCRNGAARDGVVVPELVRQIREAVGERHAAYVHFAATSQDVIDTALMLRIGSCLDIFEARLKQLDEAFSQLDQKFGANQLMGRTRMQAAITIHAGDRIKAWRAPLVQQLSRLPRLRSECLALQFGGAAGTLEKLGDKGPDVRAALALQLGLGDAPQWHAQRGRIVEIGNWLAQTTGSLGKFGQDVALMATLGEIGLAGGGTSSAMPHKHNPVAAETLVTLARFNAVQISGLYQAMVHEQERSGAAWTLEWMILPQILKATAAATRLAISLVDQITSLRTAAE